jgi:hypothetical protein
MSAAAEVRKIARRCAIVVGTPFIHIAAGRPPKKISAMIRVKNEVEYLERSISSVLEHVDEVVIVDNNSTDGSTEIIDDFAKRFPTKVRAFCYPHKLARWGEETTRLSETKGGKQSPSFLPNYYNWCASKCSWPFILKWDGDTIATAALAPTLEAFRHSRTQILWHTGINLHPDRESYIAGRPFEDMEPRLFYKPLSFYNNYLGYVETLWSPYLALYPSFSEKEPEPLYFHMKFCKSDRFSNMSDDLRRREESVSGRGNPLPQYLREQVLQLGL